LLLLCCCRSTTPRAEPRAEPPDCRPLAQRVNDAAEREGEQPRESFQVYASVCQSRCAYGCEHLGYAYERGIGVERSEPDARAAFDRARAFDPSICD
jgi:TPR repeat protein